MRFSRLGTSGLTVSALVLGTASFGDTVGADAAGQVVAAALDAGVTAFDTADVYAGGRSEEILGATLPRSMRERVVVCSKAGLRRGDSDADHAAVSAGRADHTARWARGIAPTDAGLSRKHIMRAVEESLVRLRTDYLDLYQVHRFDPETRPEETLRALDDLVTSGKVRYLGCSGYAAWQLYQALWTSDRHGFARFESVQARYNIGFRDAERELLPAARAAGVGVLAFQALAGGVLTGRTDAAGAPGRSSRDAVRGRFGTEAFIDRARRLREAGERAGVSPAQVCLGWVLSRPGVSAAVVGASSPEQLADLVTAASGGVPDEILTGLDGPGT
ncbi:hypothetical protein PZ61_0235630 [Streptomyces sp. MNU77]|uniref:aldo/keto reductase n=1 Tax=Streptomyces sp. MNU77 TaxID=1573406 RepID=UPI0005E87114|nr:aldo/keto reductase [Streptomyces sp. MNU77]OLO25772.1 hypothetical protein PZ61_0235630 [Streptomyces sp. MNU77]